jgi:hypothetical protein
MKGLFSPAIDGVDLVVCHPTPDPPKSPHTTSGRVLSGTSVQSEACPTMKTTAGPTLSSV